MPKIDIRMPQVTRALGTVSRRELEKLLEHVKGEIDRWEDDVLRVEFNDTNRPDLWSEVGLVRQLKLLRGENMPKYSFHPICHDDKRLQERTINVTKEIGNVRPYIAACVVRGRPIDETVLLEIIQMQEKLSENFGRRRETLAIGVYPYDNICFPISYTVASSTRKFRPLDAQEPMTLDQILTGHPKGIEYAHAIKTKSGYPILLDAKDNVLSFPPIINSHDMGMIREGDKCFFIECTGTMFSVVHLALNIIACNLSDMGYTIESVCVQMSDKTYTTPYYFQSEQHVNRADISRLLGCQLSDEHIMRALTRMGVPAHLNLDTITVTPPAYRNDFLHGVDIIEDIMIGHGIDTFTPELPSELTVGGLSDVELLSRELNGIMVGLGYQEMVFHYLGSREDFVEKMYPRSEWDRVDQCMIIIDNPMSMNFSYVRNSIFPALLRAESISADAVYPHSIFEIGKTVQRSLRSIHDDWEQEPITEDMVGFLHASSIADFNAVHRQVSAILYYLSLPYRFENTEDPRFITGRCALVMTENDRYIGIFGETHPRVLDAWNTQMPCTMGELSLNVLLTMRR